MKYPKYPAYDNDTREYLIELYDCESLVARVTYSQVYHGVALPEYTSVVIVDDVEYIYTINSITERYENEDGDIMTMIHKYCFEEPLGEYGLTMDNVDDIVEQLIITEEEL